MGIDKEGKGMRGRRRESRGRGKGSRIRRVEEWKKEGWVGG
jgi:hypothetical protein